MEIRFAEKEDIDGWLTLARLTADSFPGLETESFKTAIEGAIADKAAFVAIDLDKVAGAIAFSREKSEILFLAVRPDFRKQGIASGLVREAAAELAKNNKVIFVTTFRDNDISGRPAVSFYKSVGFRFCKLTYEFGYPCQVMALSADKLHNY